MTRRSIHPRGFTLIELTVATVVSGLIAAAAVSASMQLIAQGNRLGQQATADEEAKMLLDVLTTELQQVGGGSVRPQSALVVDDDCGALTIESVSLAACDSSDRIHFTSFEARPFSISSVTGDQVLISNRIDADNDGSADDCPTLNGDTFDVFMQDQVMVLHQPNVTAGWATRRCNSPINDPNGTGCGCDLATTASGYETEPDVTNANYDGGTMTLGAVYTVFRDPSDNTLRMVRPDDAGEPSVAMLAPHIFDIQFEYGFDTDSDNKVDTFAPNYDSNSPGGLRTLRIGLITGAFAPSRTTASAAQILNGPTRSKTKSWLMRPVVGTTGFRNLLLFF